MIFPSTPFIHQKPNICKDNNALRKLYENSVIEMQFEPPIKHFPASVGIYSTLLIMHWSSNHQNHTFNVIDNTVEQRYSYNNIYDLHKFSYYPGFKVLKSKFEEYTKTRSIQNKNNPHWLFTFPAIRGHNYTFAQIRGYELNADHYTFISKNKDYPSRQPKTTLTEKDIKLRITIGFPTKNECQNFINSLELFTVRFALALVKSNQNINRGELASVPMFDDYSKPITEEYAIEQLKITPDEYAFILSVIPPYYY